MTNFYILWNFSHAKKGLLTVILRFIAFGVLRLLYTVQILQYSIAYFSYINKHFIYISFNIAYKIS